MGEYGLNEGIHSNQEKYPGLSANSSWFVPNAMLSRRRLVSHGCGRRGMLQRCCMGDSAWHPFQTRGVSWITCILELRRVSICTAEVRIVKLHGALHDPLGLDVALMGTVPIWSCVRSA